MKDQVEQLAYETPRRVRRWLPHAGAAIALFTVCAGLMIWRYLRIPPVPGHDPLISQAHDTISELEKALAWYYEDIGQFPTTQQGIAALFVAPVGVRNWKGPYLGTPVIADPWGRPYVYRSPGAINARSYDLSSAGPDGISGTRDDIGN